MSAQNWRARLPTAPITPTGALADPPLKRQGRPKKTEAAKRAEAKAAAQAYTHAQIQKVAAERAGRPFTVLESLARVSGAPRYHTTAEALIASGAEDDRDGTPRRAVAKVGGSKRDESVPCGGAGGGSKRDESVSECATSVVGSLPTASPQGVDNGPEVVGHRGGIGGRGAVPADQRVGGRLQGAPVLVSYNGGAPSGAFGAFGGATPLPHTELAPAPGGGVRVRTGEEADEALCKYIHAMMLTDVWTDRMVDSMAAEHHRAAHTMRMLANRAKSRMDASLYAPEIVTSLYRRSRLVSDIALEGYLSVREPAYAAAAIKALELECKTLGLLPKDAAPTKTPAELKAALRAALARVEAMDAPEPPAEPST